MVKSRHPKKPSQVYYQISQHASQVLKFYIITTISYLLLSLYRNKEIYIALNKKWQ